MWHRPEKENEYPNPRGPKDTKLGNLPKLHTETCKHILNKEIILKATRKRSCVTHNRISIRL